MTTNSPPPSRREFLKQTALAAALGPLGSASVTQAQSDSAVAPAPGQRPNVLLVISDQYRWDCVCGYGRNPMDFTPNLDGMLRRGTAFENAFTNQPLCTPARACLFTGQYATRAGVWKNTLGLRPDAVTLATILRQAGYSTNYIGKWHLNPHTDDASEGFVPLEHRGGFNDLWQAANQLGLATDHPYHGTIWDGAGNPMTYDGIFRVDYLTNLAVDFLRRKQEKPFFLVLSQLEPHQQNDLYGNWPLFGFAPPKGYEMKFRNPYVPPDLRPLPGDWPYELANYYGDCKSIDESMGKIFQTLREQNLESNTIVIFLSDHGCHFRTRNYEYKMSGHDSSIHIPLLIQGPGFNHSLRVPELVSLVDLAPSLLAALGLPIPSAMQGESFMPLLHDPAARASWRNEVFVQVSQMITARALRTPEWTYVALAPDDRQHAWGPPDWATGDAASASYRDYQVYNNFADPGQIINLAGRDDPRELVHYAGNRSIKEVTDHLRQRLLARIEEAGEARPIISRSSIYP